MSLLERRVLFVLGKGGVGKTTVTAAIALAAVRQGLRTLAVELGGQHRLARLFDPDEEPRFDETPLHPGLVGLSIDPQRALEEYLVMTVRVRAVAERLAESRGLGYLTAAAPGVRELVTLGKVWHLTEQRARDGEPRYDLVVVDAPATGHGVALLRVPRQFAEIARVGRISTEARSVAALVEDRERTGVVVVTLPEEMPVNETLDTLDRLEDAGLGADCVVVNGVYPDLFAGADEELLAHASAQGETGAAALIAARSHLARRRGQKEESERLRQGTPLPQLELPFLFRPRVDAVAVGELAERLMPAIDLVP